MDSKNKQSNKSSRIPEVDGLRAIAVLGVIWIHNWSAFGNPSLNVGPIDVERVIAILGNGVNLFFVISGFCMYLMFAHDIQSFKVKGYLHFLKKRWVRIAPAFYTAAFVGALIFWFKQGYFPIYDLLSHLLFMHIWLPGTGQLSPPFWSLATEWHFYLILPFLIWSFTSRLGFWNSMGLVMSASLLWRIYLFYVMPHEVNFGLLAQIPSRMIEFAWGIIVARLYLSNTVLPFLLRNSQGFITGLLIAYAGRILMVNEVVKMAGLWGGLCRTLAEPILTLGFSIILLNAITSFSPFQRLLSSNWVNSIGKISYSLYLWHTWPMEWVSEGIIHIGIDGVTGQLIAFVIGLVLLIPLSKLSYSFLEAPYFKKSPRIVSILYSSNGGK